MNMLHLQWISQHTWKMDTHLKRKIVHSHRWLKKTPRFLQRVQHRFIEEFVRLPVIIQMYGDVTDATVVELKVHLEGHRVTVHARHPIIRSVSAHLSIRAIKKLCESGFAKTIYLDREVRAILDVATPPAGAGADWPRGVTGHGVTIAVIDTGICPHPDVTQPSNRIIGFKDFVGNRTTPYDDNGHGTHVAGDAAGNGKATNSQYRGPAPDAFLVGVKVLNKSGSGHLSTVISGIEWCRNNKAKYGIRVVSMSLGTLGYGPVRNDPAMQAVEQAVASGLVFTAAPIVAGYAALILQQHPDLSPDEVKALLSGRGITDVSPFMHT